jgi:DNA-binding transcriptional LysR family regulator
VCEPAVEGRLRLGITEYFVPGELPQLLARFSAAYPGVELGVRMGLSSDLREAVRGRTLDAAIVRLNAREAGKALWKEPLRWVAADGFECARDEPLPLVLLPQHAIESMNASRRHWRIAFTGSSMASVRAAVQAGLGASIVPRSSIVQGMRIPTGAMYRDPGMLHVGLVRAPGAREDIVRVLEDVIRRTF